MSSDLTHNQVQAFVGPQADYYLERWYRIRLSDSRALGFNWSAFFATESWLIYRRMYRTFWITFAGSLGFWVGGAAAAVTAAINGHRALAVVMFIVLRLSSLAF